MLMVSMETLKNKKVLKKKNHNNILKVSQKKNPMKTLRTFMLMGITLFM